MFRSSTIIRELVLSLAKVMLEHLCDGVAACLGVACVLCAVQNETESHMLPHYHITYKDIITECSNITLAKLSTSSLMMVEDRNM
jgi:hypothetical protein